MEGPAWRTGNRARALGDGRSDGDRRRRLVPHPQLSQWSYRRRGYPERIADILRDPKRTVTEIPGIGKGLAHVLAEIVERAPCERRDLLLQKFPPTALEFLKIQGLGPKSIALIFEHYRISTIDELERLCHEQKLRVLPRMGPSWKRRSCAPSLNTASP